MRETERGSTREIERGVERDRERGINNEIYCVVFLNGKGKVLG